MRLASRLLSTLTLSTAFLVMAALWATPAVAARYAYMMAGQRNEFETARFHAAVLTPSPESVLALGILLDKVFGRGVETLSVPAEGLTLVSVPESSGAPVLADVLANQSFATRVAFSGHYPNGAEAWPTVVMPEVRVRFRSRAVAESQLASLARDGISVRWARNEARDYLLSTKSSSQALQTAMTLYGSGAAEFAYPDLLYRHVKHFRPNDTYYGQQWHLQNIGAEGAWDISTGIASIVIAILDDGTDLQHADLQLNLVNGYDIVGNGYQTDNDPSPTGDDAHGTATAGIAAAVGDNNRGVSGVCPHCKIMPIRIMTDTGYSRASTEEDAFNWARSHGANVLSNSWGPAAPINANYFPDGLKAEIHNAVAENRVVIFAAGNDSSPLTCPGGVPWEPAAYNEVISVGANDFYDQVMDYSNFGNTGCPLTLVAPAATFSTDITGTRGYNSSSFGNDYTDYFGGTSAAAPVASGAVALLLSIESTLTWGQVLSVLKTTADKVGGVTYDGSGYNAHYGSGRLNLYRAATYVKTGTLCQPEVGGETYGTAACSDGRDNDCDGLVDAADPSCAPSDVNVGATCAQGCGSQGKFCLTEADGFPSGGYCTGTCTTGNVCPAGAACWTCYCDTGAGQQANCACDPDGCTCNTSSQCDPSTPNGTTACACDPDCNLCMDVCLQDNECRQGYICDYLWSETTMVCIPGCQSGFFDCAPDTCNTTTGRCEHNGPTAPGGACTQAQDCSANGYCIGSQANPDAAWPGGYCSPECPASGACPAGSECVHFTDINLCLATCAQKSDCRDGYGCWPGVVAGAKICFSVCSASDCQGGEVCCPTSAACEAPANCETNPCACNTTTACDTGCDCDTDCCTCDTTTACEAGCSCDPDCCTCDNGAGCQTGCACDPDCGGGCACNTSVDCQARCSCDPDCPAVAAACDCDKDYTCDSTCACDAECPCDCDTTHSCSDNCTCDPDCYKSGCGCASADSREVELGTFAAAGVFVWWRRRKPKAGLPG